MTTTFKRKAANAALAGVVTLGCAGAATTTALISAATDASIAHAAGANGSGGESSNFIGWCQPTLDGKTWYYFDGYDYIRDQWFKQGNTWYYFNYEGAMQTGWQKIGSTWYYLENSGAMATNKWVGNYYLTSSGAMAINTWIGNYWVGSDGAWVPGKSKGTWKKSSGKWWYAKSGSSYAVGWELIDGTWYYFDPAGWMQTGWQSIGGKWYYFNESGAMQTERWIGNYYVKSDGAMATNEWIGDYHVNANGVWDDTKETYRNMVVDNKYYGTNGQIVTFSGSHTGPYTSTYNDGQWCNGSADKTVTIDFRDYFEAADTYAIDVTCLLHYHESNHPNLQESTLTDEVITIPSIVVQQSRLLNGGQIWQGYVYNKAQSATRYVTIKCFDFNPNEGTIGIDVFESSSSSVGGPSSSIGGPIGSKYNVKLV